MVKNLIMKKLRIENENFEKCPIPSGRYI